MHGAIRKVSPRHFASPSISSRRKPEFQLIRIFGDFFLRKEQQRPLSLWCLFFFWAVPSTAKAEFTAHSLGNETKRHVVKSAITQPKKTIEISGSFLFIDFRYSFYVSTSSCPTCLNATKNLMHGAIPIKERISLLDSKRYNFVLKTKNSSRFWGRFCLFRIKGRHGPCHQHPCVRRQKNHGVVQQGDSKHTSHHRETKNLSKNSLIRHTNRCRCRSSLVGRGPETLFVQFFALSIRFFPLNWT